VTRADTSLVGTLLQGRYRVDKLLAHGGMSAVYHGFDTRLERRVAIKIMDPQHADDPSFLARFQREARAAAGLHHPNVVAVHDQGVDDTAGTAENRRVFLIMELVAGGTLRSLLSSREPLDVHTTLSVLEAVLAALATAHQAGLAHRDIKPENILLGQDREVGHTSDNGRVKVTDFGLARAVTGPNITDSGVILGTAAYLAPEQVTAGAAGAAGDVYSAGIVLYEMLTGNPPYTGDTALSVAYQHVNDEVPAPSSTQPGLPPALDTLVRQATRRDPNERLPDATTFLHEVRQLREPLGIDLVSLPVPEPSEDFPTEQIDVTAEHTVPEMQPANPPPAADQRSAPPDTRALHTGDEAFSAAADHDDPTTAEDLLTRWRGKRLVALCVVVGLLVAGGGLTWWLNARWITVPGVTGLSVSKARQTLSTAGLTGEFTREPHNAIPESTVIGTDPAGGTEALPGDHITVRISAGKPTVPNIPRGTDRSKAVQQIKNAHLTPQRDPDEDRYDDTVPEGRVLAIAPEPGTTCNVDDPVTVILSNGPAPEPVPEVSGKSKDDAFDALRDNGFEPYVAGKEFAEDITTNHVIRTDPPAESHSGVDGSMRVGVYLSTAVEVPAVKGSSLEVATKTLHDAGLRVEVSSSLGGDEADHARLALVIEQDPEPEEIVERDSTIELRTIP